MYSYKRRTNCQTILLLKEMSNAISCILTYLHYFTIYLLFPCPWGTLCTSLFRCHGTEMALSAEHKIQGAWLDLDPTPPTLHIPKPNRLHLLIPNPPKPPISIPKPTNFHPLDVDPTLPPGYLFCSGKCLVNIDLSCVLLPSPTLM